MDVAVISADASDGGYVSKLEDKIGLLWGADEPITAPGLQRCIDVVEGFGFVDREVGVSTGVGEEDGLSLLDLEWDGRSGEGLLGL